MTSCGQSPGLRQAAVQALQQGALNVLDYLCQDLVGCVTRSSVVPCIMVLLEMTCR